MTGLQGKDLGDPPALSPFFFRIHEKILEGRERSGFFIFCRSFFFVLGAATQWAKIHSNCLTASTQHLLTASTQHLYKHGWMGNSGEGG
mmetsp:Transcript_25828/g.50588  ORF Transcript_25828/g.50588 Transcript_25828/m.50588 type:complete len:89 (+) Transcript_25828:223-489(+)